MQYKNRKAIPDIYRWDLTRIFSFDEAWEKSFAELKTKISNIASYRDRLKDKVALIECLRLKDNLSIDFERLYVYANMKSHENIAVGKYQEMCSRINMFAAVFSSEMSYIVPEISKSYTKDELQRMAKEEEFSSYSYSLLELARRKERVLTDKEERILAEVSSIVNVFSSNFSKYDNVDVKWEDAKDSRFKSHKLTHGKYSLYMQSKDRLLRKNAHFSMMNGYKSMINTLSSNYSGNIQSDVMSAKLRGYKSSLEHSMDSENIKTEVYDKLIHEVNKYIPLLKNYLAYRKDKMGYNEHKAFDMYVNVEKNKEIKLSFDQAFDIVIEGLKPLGEDYINLLNTARSERWIDVYESEGKRSGGYSWGCFGTPPYILLNYNDTLREAFTLAHELGHSMHSYLSDNKQPYAKAQYEIFVAEIASTVNEMLLIRHMLEGAKPSLKKYLLTYLLDMYKGTVFRQCLFAEFELKAHNRIESGGGLSAESLCKMYEELNKKYYGKSFLTPVLQYEWARIPHFYNSFYVYKYATGLIAATMISENIFNNADGAVGKYKEFLEAGGSASPLDILKIAGVDLTTDEPYNKAFGLFESTLKELKKL